MPFEMFALSLVNVPNSWVKPSLVVAVMVRIFPETSDRRFNNIVLGSRYHKRGAQPSTCRNIANFKPVPGFHKRGVQSSTYRNRLKL